ncbi:hypothetical protein MKW94_030015 [Papaver nudicaule]|uniref:Uncharacterized protein n=1 Tax=Papaver nudicaule TaxID=74823 RepID=A0AA41S8V6_PAPNU|nr:hypothetical protein [Papaver nudicaule]
MEGRNILPGIVPAACFCPHPFVAIEVEGQDAISKVHHHLTSEPGVRAYSSDSVKSSKEDCELWFGMDSADWKKEARESNHLACALPDGETFGPVETVMDKLWEEDRLRYRCT